MPPPKSSLTSCLGCVLLSPQVVADRGLQQGDLAIVNFSAKRADTGEELPGATRNSMRLDTDDADTTFLPGGRGCFWHPTLARWPFTCTSGRPEFLCCSGLLPPRKPAAPLVIPAAQCLCYCATRLISSYLARIVAILLGVDSLLTLLSNPSFFL